MEVDLDQIHGVAGCTTLHRIMNFGTEEHAYFQYIQDSYDYLPPFVLFVQGGGLSENPHLVYDLMAEEIPGLEYTSLTRYVADAWHMFGTDLNAAAENKTKEAKLLDKLFSLLKEPKYLVDKLEGYVHCVSLSDQTQFMDNLCEY
jgi:hypothetical protein